MSDARTILQISTSDRGGGAERVALNLHQGYRDLDHDAFVAVGRKRGDDPRVLAVDSDAIRSGWTRFWQGVTHELHTHEHRTGGTTRLRVLTNALGQPDRWWAQRKGLDDFNFPATRGLARLTPRRPDVIHAHNLHGEYFDLTALPMLSRQAPLVVTLHDAWMLTGHCAHPVSCGRWKTGCGRCPSLGTYPAIKRDATAANWTRKASIYEHSSLYLVTPSRWLMKQVEGSMLARGIADARVIPNGVDRAIHTPADRAAARESLGLPQDTDILLFAANGIRKSDFKDFQTLQAVLARLGSAPRSRPLLLLALGEAAEPQQIGHAELRFVPHVSDERVIAAHYQASDIYVHAAKVDTFPMTVLEAMACGTPVVASAVGGIPEQVEEGVTGFLTASGDADAMAARIAQLLDDPAQRRLMGEAAAARAAERFDLRTQVAAHLAWYEHAIERWRQAGKRTAA